MDQGEIRKFTDLCCSPYFNKHEELRQFCTYLLSLWPEFEAASIELEAVQQTLENPDLDAKQLTHYFAYTLDLLMDFMALEQLDQGLANRVLLALQAIAPKGHAKKWSRSLATRLRRELQRSPSKGQAFYWTAYSLHDALDQQFLAAPTRTQDPNLQRKSEYLDIFYIYSKLKMACDMTSRNIVIQANYQCQLLDEVKAIIGQHPFYLEVEGIRIYWEILSLLESGDDEKFLQLKKSLHEVIQNFDAEEIRLMYDYAQNFCIRQINSGRQRYYAEFLDLYKTQLQEKVLFRNGFLEEWDYKNIVTAGVRTKEFEWTEHFIQRNRRYLRPSVQENAYIYNLANLYYEMSRYRDALQLLHQVEFTDLSYHLGAKNIQLKSYYELDEFAAFNALIRAYRASVKRARQLSSYRQQSYLNFLRIAQKIGDCKQRLSYAKAAHLKKRFSEIQELLLNSRPLANSDWLEEVSQDLGAAI